MRRPLAFLLLLALPTAAVAGAPRPSKAVSAPARVLKLREVPLARIPSGLQPLVPRKIETPGGSGWVTLLPTEEATSTTGPADRVANMPSAAVGHGLVYASRGFHEHTIHALDARTGRPRWEVKLHDNGPSTVTVTPRRVYACSESCTAAAITPRSGKKVWEREIGPTVAGAPTVVGNRVFAAHTTKDQSTLLTAMDGKTGEVIWHRPIAQDLIGAPVHHGKHLYLTDRGGVVSCFGVDGSVQWFTSVRAASAPWIDRSRLYVTTDLSWRKGAPAVRCLEASTGRTVWWSDPEASTEPGTQPSRYASSNAIVESWSSWAADPPRPAVIGERCVIAGGPKLVVLRAKDGWLERIWHLPGEQRFHSAPAVLGKRLLFATFRGLLLEIEPRTGRIAQTVDLRCAVTSQPVVEGGWVYVTSRGRVIGMPWKGARAGEDYPQWGGGPGHDGQP